MPTISKTYGLEVLDSRGRPTVKAYFELSNGIMGAASVPSGASTGAAEAYELRDGDPDRYRGMGCRKAVENINTRIQERLHGQKLLSQAELDQILLDLDGTPNKTNLGANAILAVSLAYARTLSNHYQFPLYRYFAHLANREVDALPRLTVNLFSGGKHAGAQVPIQDLLIVPRSVNTTRESLEQVNKVYLAAVELVYKKFGMRWLTADEGGLAPGFTSLEQLFETSLKTIELSGFEPGREVAMALDVAASHFYRESHYLLKDESLTSPEMIARLTEWVNRYPIISLEDGLAEEDWPHWPRLKAAVKDRCLVLGDDLLCTNLSRMQKAIDTDAANALLLKVNQTGTLTEALSALKLARSHNWQVTISARSGETEDDWLADLAVGWGGDQIKVGSVTQSERLAKYNRLLEIEASTGLPVKPWPS